MREFSSQLASDSDTTALALDDAESTQGGILDSLLTRCLLSSWTLLTKKKTNQSIQAQRLTFGFKILPQTYL